MVRIKERYLLVKILYPNELGSRPDLPDVVVINQPTTDQLNSAALLRGIRAEVTNLFGDYGSGAIEGGNLGVKYFSHATSTFILRISRSSYRLVWTALTFMNSIPIKNGKPCVFRVVHVSGTMRKVEEEAIRRARDLIFTAQNDQKEKTDDPLSNMFRKSERSQPDVAMADLLSVEDDDSDVEMGEIVDD
ncbi:Rpp14 family protein [Annulohypoxylon maeteangense]|uniref:Rpp14 family protein n=1 Tax=Annulohypoxylon maeteangense TaxID=1927788 RepID=UPI0020080673|nr:Rpp14 family protein [Annulohypoxylon maeteangense]KAI0889233.1 Rpp14 family protein [Annulohypoxylon maeteangense]